MLRRELSLIKGTLPIETKLRYCALSGTNEFGETGSTSRQYC